MYLCIRLSDSLQAVDTRDTCLMSTCFSVSIQVGQKRSFSERKVSTHLHEIKSITNGSDERICFSKPQLLLEHAGKETDIIWLPTAPQLHGQTCRACSKQH